MHRLRQRPAVVCALHGDGHRMARALRRFPLLALIACALGSSACATVPKGRITVDKIAFEGNDEVSSTELKKNIATRETKRFLRLVRGVLYDYELFNRHVLERDLQRIERHYRARGYQIHVQRQSDGTIQVVAER